MRPSPKLGDLHSRVSRRLARLGGVLDRIRSDRFVTDTDARVAFVTMELMNTWRSFARAYYTSCVLSAVTMSGACVRAAKPGVDENEAIGRAVKCVSKRARPRPDGGWHWQDEPRWHYPKPFIEVCKSQGLSNIDDIEAALSTGDKTLDHLPVFRNFFGHKDFRTRKGAQELAPRYGIPATWRPTRILLTPPLKRSQPLIREWIDHVSFTVEFLCA